MEITERHVMIAIRAMIETLGKMVDMTCNCGYLLPSKSALNPQDHKPGCHYRRLAMDIEE